VNPNGRVLVVDDEPAIRALVATIVDRAGLPVDTAHHGADAIAKMKAMDYTVVVVDLNMPILDGFGVVEYVRSRPEPRPAVIVITAGDVPLRRLDGRIVHSVLHKPFDIDELGDLIVAVVKTVAGEDQQRDENIVRFPQQTR